MSIEEEKRREKEDKGEGKRIKEEKRGEKRRRK